MCMRHTSTPASATTPARSGSRRSALTSFTIAAPSATARRATSERDVSIDTGRPESASSTGTTRRSSSSCETSSAPGRVDSPPTSTRAAPSASMRLAARVASSADAYDPPSEKLSGVTLRIPTTEGRGQRSADGPLMAGTLVGSARAALGGGRVGRRLHRRAGQRPGRRPEERLLLRVGLLGRRRGRLLGEDRLLGLPLEQTLELALVDRLALDEDRRQLVELGHVLAEHRRRLVVRLLDHPADLVVDLLRDLLRVVRLGAHLTAEERHVVVAAEHAGAELLAHAEPHDHLLRGRRDPLDVVRR